MKKKIFFKWLKKKHEYKYISLIYGWFIHINSHETTPLSCQVSPQQFLLFFFPMANNQVAVIEENSVFQSFW